MTIYAYVKGQRIKVYPADKDFYTFSDTRKKSFNINYQGVCAPVVEWWGEQVEGELELETKALHSNGLESWDFASYTSTKNDRKSLAFVCN
ncbi:MAG: hypothetical protein COV44_01100 [Deltaproteobacteria bacterium CG11_big_fil_rev_8_21_14_0_20_45_16]|nr:MAG: hypothetical protein COV44_01100 [Deltaproteobacteria bacterium CG11_big_fil_rev_8_21_14_0_20_45_16]